MFVIQHCTQNDGFRQQEGTIIFAQEMEEVRSRGHVKKVRGLTDKTLRALVNGLEKGKNSKLGVGS